MSEPTEFRIDDPLPTGTTLLEASAGTGKTWAIAALVARFVAEGEAELDDLLVVTFGRAASAELRDRVRERLVDAEASLTHDTPTDPDDPLLALLHRAGTEERQQRRRRLRRAIGRFDEATITTTHGFCHAVLRSLGTTGDVEPGTTLVEDDGDLVADVVSDLYLRAVGRGAVPPFGPDLARTLGAAAVGDPAARLHPVEAKPDSEPELRRRFASAVRDESARRRLAARTLSYDDLLQRLAEALEDPDAPARTVMRERWRIVLVDEFQDTDPVQWQILERAFVGHATMILVGDPKQAIYAFRGGDVATYLRAAEQATDRRTLLVNHRSDEPVVRGVDALMRGAALGDPRIVVRPARAARSGSRLTDPGSDAAVRLRVVTRDDARTPAERKVSIATARRIIARDVAGDVVALLTSGATYDPGDGPRPVRAGDIAVLVERHADGDLLHAALAEHGVAAVRGGGTDVLASEAGEAWVALLTALESPHRSGLVRAAATGPFLGLRAEELAAGAERLTDDVAARLRTLVEVQRSRGTAGLVEAVVGDVEVVARVLGEVGGRRRLTDLQHVGHVLQQAAREHDLGLGGLLRWLVDRRADGAQASTRSRRLDSDADAVQILTTHVSKGLQYPVVYAPFLFNRWVGKPDLVRFHDEHGERSLDVGGDAGPGRAERVEAGRAEEAGESLRRLYVALTRAQCRVVLHWCPTQDAANAALHRLLFRPDPTRPDVPHQVAVPSDQDAVQRLRTWQEHGAVAVEPVRPRPVDPLEPARETAELAVRSLDRSVDLTWGRTSYTSLVRVDETPGVGSEPTVSGPDDEVAVTVAADGGLGPSPWADLAGGAALGTLVHGVLEDLDPTADDLESEVALRVAEQLARRPLAVDTAVLVPALVAAVRTPLGPFVDDLTLLDVLAARPLREVEFELPLGGGDRPSGRPGTLADVADLMESTLPDGDPLRPFAPDLRGPELRGRTLRGYLTGSIDLLMRTPDGRTLVVDHKTNRLEPPDGGLGAYAPERLADAMLHTTYPLQAMLYTVAQHRFLRWRLRGYDPDTHLAGVLYLFVRGMTGPDVPRGADGTPFGVFSWRPPTALVLGLSDLLDGGPR
ncbi:MAG: UvrD-helicase domain-containing protein [Aeromicrobium erythreum]